jgi:hypothetical protein
VAASATLASRRIDEWNRAGALGWRVQGTLTAARDVVPPQSAIDCSALPDNISGAYAYRNGCDSQVRFIWPGDSVRGTRTVNGHPVDALSTNRAMFAAEFALSSNGAELRRVR